MTLYLDASALVKRYVRERGTDDVDALMTAAAAVATALVSRAEVAAALARAVRGRVLGADAGQRARRKFLRDWPDLARVPVTEALAARADSLAWSHGLRGYDAVQLAAALTWQEAVGSDVVLATFDRELWRAAATAGVETWPESLGA
ncbi:MAG: type II toxin-antitoxin system VapC family toxin [Acidobacteria bacterium]|nr:type II toxin-antitoxin system VapC family toxin [Acidobacteriota bacterium]